MLAAFSNFSNLFTQGNSPNQKPLSILEFLLTMKRTLRRAESKLHSYTGFVLVSRLSQCNICLAHDPLLIQNRPILLVMETLLLVFL
ncbi:hypothetical protein T01_13351 [Trichinella spiralis]|uniref:Uncharacterized protein n=1 Tax=Trichinella spiralis TaxID=6334 RepID=A0A0V1AXS8_TRISP|nr:hypothetical protein T01_2767 [Trichinella spiralis]KRY29570.1 hypothetical protein T01_13351 [Trichinella spiralis]